MNFISEAIEGLWSHSRYHRAELKIDTPDKLDILVDQLGTINTVSDGVEQLIRDSHIILTIHGSSHYISVRISLFNSEHQFTNAMLGIYTDYNNTSVYQILTKISRDMLTLFSSLYDLYTAPLFLERFIEPHSIQLQNKYAGISIINSSSQSGFIYLPTIVFSRSTCILDIIKYAKILLGMLNISVNNLMQYYTHTKQLHDILDILYKPVKIKSHNTEYYLLRAYDMVYCEVKSKQLVEAPDSINTSYYYIPHNSHRLVSTYIYTADTLQFTSDKTITSDVMTKLELYS